jgi:type IV pilus assembly protein PilC
MPRFAYIAIDSRGVEQTGSLDASDLKHAATALGERGLFPMEVTPARAPSAATPGAAGRQPFTLGRVVQPKELAVFTRQLGTLLRAGLPLLRGLEVLGKQQVNLRFRRTIDALGEAIRAGSTLSDAMQAHPRVFPRIYVNMIRAGEAGGALDRVLERLAGFQEKSLQLQGRIRAALVYPVVVLGVALAILAGLLLLVVPKFKQIFADLLRGAPLPPLTRAVLAVSEAVQHHAALLGAVLALAVVTFAFARRTSAGSRVVDVVLLRVPLFGDLIRRTVVARFARTLGTLLATNVPILGALLIARDTCGNVRLGAAIQHVHDRVKEGTSVARPLEDTRAFPPLVGSMVEVGEQTGQLAEMLGKVADIYEEEVDAAVAGLSSLIEPMLILFLALVVGTIVIALFLPIIRIVQLLS